MNKSELEALNKEYVEKLRDTVKLLDTIEKQNAIISSQKRTIELLENNDDSFQKIKKLCNSYEHALFELWHKLNYDNHYHPQDRDFRTPVDVKRFEDYFMDCIDKNIEDKIKDTVFNEQWRLNWQDKRSNVDIDVDSQWYKNCVQQRKRGSKCCNECPFRSEIQHVEKEMEE